MKYSLRIVLWIVILVLASMTAFYVNSTFVIVPFVVLSFVLLMPRDLLRSPRILLWAFFIIISLLLIGFNLNASGFVVTGVSSQATGIGIKEVIYKINDLPADSQINNNFSGTVKIDTNRGTKFVRVNGTLGIEIEPVSATNLRFGLDLKGGVRAVLEPNVSDNATIEQIISTLQTRINVYGLREAVFRPLYNDGKGFIEISIASGNREELRTLLENQGKFEAKITIEPRLVNNLGMIKLGHQYNFSASGDTILISGIVVNEKETFELNDILFELDTISQNKVNMTATVFEGSDIKTVFFDPQRSRIELAEGGYRWSFAVQLSQEGAQRFALVTSNLDVVPGTGSLSSPIVLYLDNNLVDSLSISSTLKGRSETEISISGSAESQTSAAQARAQLQSILRSGALPTEVKIVQLDTVSAVLGIGFLKNAMLAGFVAIIGVIMIVSIRYRKIKIVLPMLAISLSEILIILGIASFIGWTIDLPAIAGIIASVGSGINSQIVIIDQALRREAEAASLREKLKNAFFVIFGAGGTVIAAMLPLMIIGFGLLRGFAITTIIGVLVGILVARPAYGAIVQRIIKD